MSFNRLKYDSEDSRLSQNSSAKAASYFTQPPILTTHCLQENPRIINQHNGVSMPRDVEWRFYTGPVDIESDLMGVHRVASRCPTKKYTPSNLDSLGNNDFEDRTFDPKSMIRMVDFTCEKFPTEDTRLSNPSCNLRGTGINRFEDLCLDPQSNIFIPTQVNVDSRMMAKDNYKPRGRGPHINDMNPNMGPLPCIPLASEKNNVCANYVGNMYQFNKCG
jgi:hypothetical protein